MSVSSAVHSTWSLSKRLTEMKEFHRIGSCQCGGCKQLSPLSDLLTDHSSVFNEDERAAASRWWRFFPVASTLSIQVSISTLESTFPKTYRGLNINRMCCSCPYDSKAATITYSCHSKFMKSSTNDQLRPRSSIAASDHHGHAQSSTAAGK